jgi:hypothetical protein
VTFFWRRVSSCFVASVHNYIKFILSRNPNRLEQVTWNLRDCGSGSGRKQKADGAFGTAPIWRYKESRQLKTSFPNSLAARATEKRYLKSVDVECFCIAATSLARQKSKPTLSAFSTYLPTWRYVLHYLMLLGRRKLVEAGAISMLPNREFLFTDFHWR